MNPISSAIASLPSSGFRSDPVTVVFALGGLAFMVLLLYAIEDAYSTGYEKGVIDATIERMERKEDWKE